MQKSRPNCVAIRYRLYPPKKNGTIRQKSDAFWTFVKLRRDVWTLISNINNVIIEHIMKPLFSQIAVHSSTPCGQGRLSVWQSFPRFRTPAHASIYISKIQLRISIQKECSQHTFAKSAQSKIHIAKRPWQTFVRSFCTILAIIIIIIIIILWLRPWTYLMRVKRLWRLLNKGQNMCFVKNKF